MTIPCSRCGDTDTEFRHWENKDGKQIKVCYCNKCKCFFEKVPTVQEAQDFNG